MFLCDRSAQPDYLINMKSGLVMLQFEKSQIYPAPGASWHTVMQHPFYFIGVTISS